tara:strand:+ start:27 stop:149 length:123 start_codon:yes stop_codon:yes gene_type:complete
LADLNNNQYVAPRHQQDQYYLDAIDEDYLKRAGLQVRKRF